MFRINENFIQQLSAMFTCRDGEMAKMASLVTKLQRGEYIEDITRWREDTVTFMFEILFLP